MAHEASDFESALEAYPVKLQNFEGPLDLLIHLIKRNEVNVYDIPIALITEQYLAYLGLMQEMNLDLAGEFLVMAATLIHIKSRLLLPRPTADVEGLEEEEDPREALVRRLLEHQRFKAAAELLHDRETLRSAQFHRPESAIADVIEEPAEPELEVDLFSLLGAFRAVLDRARTRPSVMLPPEQMSIEQRIDQLLERLSETDAVGFEDLFADADSRPALIVTFLALLEMIRLKLIRVFQSGSFGAIRVYKRARPADAPHPIMDPETVYNAHQARNDEQRTTNAEHTTNDAHATNDAQERTTDDEQGTTNDEVQDDEPHDEELLDDDLRDHEDGNDD
jgi:segregation and condensation protein A